MACLSPSSDKEKAPYPPPNLNIFHSAKIYMKLVFENIFSGMSETVWQVLLLFSNAQ